MNLPLIWLSKVILLLSRILGLGAGSTWPGHIMLSVNPSFLRQFNGQFTGKIIIVAGTNGKTTTSKLLRTILETDGQRVIHNESGANLLNGVASSIIEATSLTGSLANVAIFEVDENSLPLLLKELTPDVLVILNLFRDQLDRYGEVDSIASKWRSSLLKLPKRTTLILNADDPYIAYLGNELLRSRAAEYPSESSFLAAPSSQQVARYSRSENKLKVRVTYFGIDDRRLYLASRPHAMDVIYCPDCSKRLTFEGIYFAHLGKWQCRGCGLRRPPINSVDVKEVLPGIYNMYNTQAALLATGALGIRREVMKRGLKSFTPAFGRQEEFTIDGKTIKIFLSKNPAGFNESIRTVKKLGGQNFLVVLNDSIPDGRDVSWIWDVDFEVITNHGLLIHVSGDRVYDMALRFKYAGCPTDATRIHADLKKAMQEALQEVPGGETLYVLPTYSAMLEVRKILTGKKIL